MSDQVRALSTLSNSELVGLLLSSEFKSINILIDGSPELEIYHEVLRRMDDGAKTRVALTAIVSQTPADEPQLIRDYPGERQRIDHEKKLYRLGQIARTGLST